MLIERFLGKKALVRKMPFQKTDMLATWADIGKARKLLDWEPKVSLEEGIERTVAWYVSNRHWARDIRIDMSK